MKHFSFRKHEESSDSSAESGKEVEVQVTGLSPIELDKKKEERQEKPKAIIIHKNEDVKILSTYNFISDNIPITI